MEVKVSRDTKVVIGLSEAEAVRLKAMLCAAFSFESEPLANQLFDALDDNEIADEGTTWTYDGDYFVRDGE